ncbi:Uncharacterized protein FWK35_00008453 [Aphis craccivora]|uniref:Uncharacterized protein n=1 Tax=Aphis craccivora TaxID=307492 RepID=A0A6G0Z9U4_APHCR|nr:Uncharacterized protein FWK35_00008453 [Aphis craccivora]
MGSRLFSRFTIQYGYMVPSKNNGGTQQDLSGSLNRQIESQTNDVASDDMVWRYRVLSTLIKWDINGHMFKFLTNFLTNCSFRVKIQNTLSDSHYIEKGLPQGSALSVSHFLVAIKDIGNNLPPPPYIGIQIINSFTCEYGSVIYGTAKAKTLSLFDPIHNQGIRFATGSFRTNPVTSILCNAGEPPF